MTYSSSRLKKFFSSYFHQDWKSEYHSYDEAVEDYCSCGDLKDRQLVVKDLDELIFLADKGILLEWDLYQNYGCYFIPSKNDISLIEWLLSLKNKIEIEIAKNHNTT
ncbi:MAG: contact-dependent growth inhibition system immunity protein [Reinekea sp.]